MLAYIYNMRKKPTISFTIDNKIYSLMEDHKVNKSKLIESLVINFFINKKAIPKKFYYERQEENSPGYNC